VWAILGRRRMAGSWADPHGRWGVAEVSRGMPRRLRQKTASSAFSCAYSPGVAGVAGCRGVVGVYTLLR